MIALFVLALYPHLSGQDINKEVYVVRPYEPTLSDAVKINFLPENKDVKFATPLFEYSISPKRLENSFIPDPIKPAKTMATSLPKIYNSWLKLGLGNYTTSLAEFNISNIRSKEYAYGAYLYHKSSKGNIRLFNDDKVPAGYAVDNVKLYGSKFYPKMKITGDVHFDHQGFHYYGYNTDLFNDSVPVINSDSIRQRTYLFGLDLGIASTHTDSTHLNYNMDFRYEYFWDKIRNKENRFLVEAGMSKNFRGLMGGLDLSVDYAHTNADIDTASNTVIRLSPWISKRRKDWKFLLGFETVVDVADLTNYYFYPHASLDIIIIEKVLIPFFGLSGELQRNTYMELMNENQFIVPGLNLKSTSSNLIIFGGLKGSISSAVRFRADVTYTALKNMHFFVIDTLSYLQNQFTAEYDEVDLITYHGQVVVQPSPSFNVSLDAKYFDYNMLDQDKPWHKPDFRIGLDAVSQLGKKFTLGAGFTVIGTRWVKNSKLPEGTDKIKPVADINLKLNYNYSKAFTIFTDIYNIADRSYLIWDQYPSQRFNFMFGLSYKL
jgi:hypothetical protein